MLGGTFDPVHNGHLAIARRALDELALTRVLLIPNGVPPHRAAPQASGPQRLELLRLATAGCERLLVDDRELRRGGASYTVDTLRELRREYGDSRLVLLIGADAFADIRQWSRWQQLFALAEVAVFARPGGAGLPPGVPTERVRLLAGRELDVSSSTVRARLAAGQDCSDLLPPAVAERIVQLGLYQGPVASA